MHAAAAMLTITSLIVSPVFAETQNAQSQSAQDQQSQAPAAQQAQPPSQPAPAASAASSAPGRDLRLSDGPDYSRGKPFFPNIIAPYTQQYVPAPMLTNTPKIAQLIQDGKLMLSIDDAISLALENNLAISIQRYTPWIAQTQLLLAKAGGVPQSGSTEQVVLGAGPAVSFDPVITATQCGWSHGNIPVNNPFTSGTGTTSILAIRRASTPAQTCR
jgi:outer membrane protein